MSSPFDALSARETAPSMSAFIPRRLGDALHSRWSNRKRSGAPKRAEMTWRACPASSPDTLTPVMRTPFGIRFEGPVEGASAIAAQRTSTNASAARFQSDICTTVEATLFTSKMLRPTSRIRQIRPDA